MALTKLRETRCAMKMTQKELAEKSGVSRVTINQIERESRQIIKSSTIKALAKALDVQPNELFPS